MNSSYTSLILVFHSSSNRVLSDEAVVEGLKLKPNALGNGAVVDGFNLLSGDGKKGMAQQVGVEVGMVLEKLNSIDVVNMSHEETLEAIALASKAPFMLQFVHAVRSFDDSET